jgi:hypothetical protein
MADANPEDGFERMNPLTTRAVVDGRINRQAA